MLFQYIAIFLLIDKYKVLLLSPWLSTMFVLEVANFVLANAEIYGF